MSLRLVLSLSILLILVAATATTAATLEELRENAMDKLGGYLANPASFLSEMGVSVLDIPKLLSGGSLNQLRNVFDQTLSINRNTAFTFVALPNKFALYGAQKIEDMLGDPQKCTAPLKGNYNPIEAAVPDTKDWRQIVGPVKDQGHCGSGWAFSATGALEAAYYQAYGKGITLSKQQLVDCDKNFNNSGCHDGVPSQAFEYIKHNGGIATDEAYPYKGSEGVCQFQPENVGAKVLGSVNITKDAEGELMHAVGWVGPVAVTFSVIPSLLYYAGGIYNDPTCTSGDDTGHAGLVVGYGVERDVPYWIIKNSWGNDWGEAGYFRLLKDHNMCGIASCASYPVVA